MIYETAVLYVQNYNLANLPRRISHIRLSWGYKRRFSYSKQ
ncbi:hypothetical protein MtrunA17_Chr1g0201511 [Medicago truncatula]|uniref:Uncharacterized protein n=1 Tax=Medicago truncatula TaxID=3880 RepID=A0A396K0Q2_MEDTR|nr:hypothetical protein MtrunA17_Chr1g0201511 [Medicago truncatula]